jgi:hypothetical protein
MKAIMRDGGGEEKCKEGGGGGDGERPKQE